MASGAWRHVWWGWQCLWHNRQTTPCSTCGCQTPLIPTCSFSPGHLLHLLWVFLITWATLEWPYLQCNQMSLWCSMSTKANFRVTFNAIPIVSISHIATSTGEPRLLYIQLYTCTTQTTQHTHTTHWYTTCTKPVTDTYQTMHMTTYITQTQ